MESHGVSPCEKVNFVQRVADRFRQSPGTWINALELETVGGRFAWRTRVSDCRKQFGMVIENRVRTVTQDGRVFKVSEYRYLTPEVVAEMNRLRTLLICT